MKKFNTLKTNNHSTYSFLFTFLMLVVFSNNLSYGQITDSIEFENLVKLHTEIPGCDKAGISNASFVEYQTSISAVIEFGNTFDRNVILKDPSGRPSTLQLQNNQLVLTDLSKGKSYTLSAKNSCGKVEDVFSFTPRAGLNGEKSETIQVSKKLFNLLTFFNSQREGSQLPLFDYLNKTAPEVHILEKLAYYQQSIMEGKPVDDRDKGKSLITKHKGDVSYVGCRCSVLSLAENVSPGTYNAFSEQNEYVGQTTINYDFDDTGGNANAFKNGYSNSIGAHKYQYAQTNGWKHNPCTETVSYDINGNGDQQNWPNISKLSLHLICNDGNEMPENCGCEKQIAFSYQYNATTKTVTNISSGGLCGGQRKAKAQAKDMSVVYCELTTPSTVFGEVGESMVHIIDAMEVETNGQCESSLNPQFYSNLGSFGDVLLNETANALYLVENGFSSENLETSELSLENLGNALDAVAGNHYFEETDCSDGITQGTMEGDVTAFLIPNRTMSFIIRSNAQTYASGRRNWMAKGIAGSNFGMGLVVKPGNGQSLPKSCCTPWAAIYSASTTDMRETIGSMLHLFDMDNCLEWIGGHPNTVGDFGSCLRPATIKECDVEINGIGND
ncbi:MAG: hypothetical protein AB8H03_01150 [Saprospiraceae bacterium]